MPSLPNLAQPTAGQAGRRGLTSRAATTGALVVAVLLAQLVAVALAAPAGAAPPVSAAGSGTVVAATAPAPLPPLPGVPADDAEGPGDADADGLTSDAENGGLPAAPAPNQPPVPAVPGLPDLGGTGESPLDSPLLLVLLIGSISLIPALLIMATAFTRIVIVLGFVRSALGTNGIPPNQVIIGLALFLSLFVMAPTFSEANEQAVQPLMRGEVSQQVALERGIEPFRDFMFSQVREEDLALFVRMSKDERPADVEDVATTTLIPAFVLSELRTAFLIGFVIFIPFIIIDLIVSAALSAMGMMMLPPVLISLPFKLLLFVAADGWSLVVESLLSSFAA